MTVTAVEERDPDLLHEASEWFARLDGNEFLSDERQHFEAWRRRSPDHERAFQVIRSTWSAPELENALSALQPVACNSPSPAESRSRHRRAWKTTSAAAMLAILAVWWGLNADLLTILQADYRTSTGEQRTVQLEDRSTILLNTNTAIAVQLDEPVRRVRLLQGEALFQVHRDPDRPFIVEHENSIVRVLGTEFMVREQDHRTTITVVHGTVEVGTSDGTVPPTQLAAGQQITEGPDGLGSPHNVDVDGLTAWTGRRLHVTNVPLSGVIEEIQRYHPGLIWIWNPAIGSVRVTGIYDLSDTMNTLKTLARTLPIHMDRLTDRLVILR